MQPPGVIPMISETDILRHFRRHDTRAGRALQIKSRAMPRFQA